MLNPSLSYPAKLLLIGEYTLLQGYAGLAIPFDKYSGSLSLGNNDKVSNKTLRLFSKYLDYMKISGFNREQLNKDLENGLYFDSDIPQGYGAGSSGAVIAAIYEQYFTHKKLSNNALKLKLGELESFFHGNSSGGDPLVSYTRSIVLLGPKGRTVKIKADNIEKGFFLIDTQKERNTQELVAKYTKKYEKEQGFRKQMKKLGQYNQEVIVEILTQDDDDDYLIQKKKIFELIKHISILQFHTMSDWIPESHRSLWKKSIQSDLYSIKLNGAGGGGYLLGYTNDQAQFYASKDAQEFDIIKLGGE